MSNISLKTGLSTLALVALLAACNNPQETIQSQTAAQTAPEIKGDLFQPRLLNVAAIGRIEAQPDVAVIVGKIDIEDSSHDGVMSEIADIMNRVQVIADSAQTEMSYTKIQTFEQADEDCGKENQTAEERLWAIRSAMSHNLNVERQITALENRMKLNKENHTEEIKKENATLRKLNRNRDIPEFRRDIFDLEEEITELEEDYDTRLDRNTKSLAALSESLKEVKPRLSSRLCGITSIKGQLNFTARIHPAENAPDFMNQFTGAGVTEINLYGYDFSDYDALYKEAAVQAVKNAKQKAELIAERSGTRLKKVKAFTVSQPTRFGRFGPQSKTIVVNPQSANYITIPPVFETISEPVVVQEASTELVTIPATYETVTETFVVQEASTELVTVPATYRTVTETVVVQPQYVQNGQTVPAVTKQITRRVVDVPARTQERVIPAVTQQIQRRVVKAPASTQERVIPAVTKMETRRVIKTPARTIENIVPQVTQQVDTGENNALKRSILSGPQTIEVSALMVFDYHTALDNVRIVPAHTTN